MRRVYLDACAVIYLLESVEPFSKNARHFLVRNADAVLCVSPLVRMEVLIKPLRESSIQLVADYEDFLAAQHWLSINDSTFDLALKLRVQHGLKTPDALHLATAIQHSCNEFWTNDDRLNRSVGSLAVNMFADVEGSGK